MNDAPTPAAELPARQVAPGTRKMFVTACVIDLILAFCTLLVGVLAQANSPTGKGAGLEMLVALLIFTIPPVVAWGLYNNSRVGIRWLMLLVWAPIVLLAIGLPLSIAYA